MNTDYGAQLQTDARIGSYISKHEASLLNYETLTNSVRSYKG
jgi:hypothetical protein